MSQPYPTLSGLAIISHLEQVTFSLLFVHEITRLLPSSLPVAHCSCYSLRKPKSHVLLPSAVSSSKPTAITYLHYYNIDVTNHLQRSQPIFTYQPLLSLPFRTATLAQHGPTSKFLFPRWSHTDTTYQRLSIKTYHHSSTFSFLQSYI